MQASKMESIRDFSSLPFFFFFFTVLVLEFWSEDFGVDIRHVNASLLLELSEIGDFYLVLLPFLVNP